MYFMKYLNIFNLSIFLPNITLIMTGCSHVSNNYKGDLVAQTTNEIAIIAPAGKISSTIIEQIAYHMNGHEIPYKFGKYIIGNHPYYSNTDEYRFCDLVQALNDDNVNIIWCARGGLGSSRMVHKLQYLSKIDKPKLFIGFSDITAILLFLNQKWHWKVLHAPTLNYLTVEDLNNSIKTVLLDIIKGKSVTITTTIKPLNSAAHTTQSLSGVITGGNLSLIQRSIGTPWQIECKDKILFFEDVHETPRKVIEVLDHLYHAGILNGVKAIIIGSFSSDKTHSHELYTKTILYEDSYLHKISVPVFFDFAVGHHANNNPVYIGEQVSIIKSTDNVFIYKQTISRLEDN